MQIPIRHIHEVSVTRHRFRPASARLLERHLHRGPVPPPTFHKVRVAYRSPVAETLKEHPPVGALMWDEGPEGSVIFTLVVTRTKDLVPWLLSCGETVEVLEPADLRREIHRVSRTMAARHASEAFFSKEGLSSPEPDSRRPV